jgi:hypothetical protein
MAKKHPLIRMNARFVARVERAIGRYPFCYLKKSPPTAARVVVRNRAACDRGQ